MSRHAGAPLACLAVLIAQAVLLFSPGLASPSAAEARQDPRFGVVEAYRAPDLATRANVAWERIIFYWHAIQPGSASDWNGAYLPDDLLQREQSQGRSVVGLLIGTPPWASDGHRRTDVPRNLYLPYDHPENYWGQFVRRIVAQYRGRIDDWVIWNEPDVSDPANPGFTWGGSEADFYQLTKVAYQAAHEANPEARVLLAGLTYWWDETNGRPQYLERFLQVASQDPTAAEKGYYFDAAVLQLYNDPAGLRRVVLDARRRLASHGLDKPIWINETNVAIWDDPSHPLSADWFRATQEEQAAYLVQAFAYALSADVERISIYKMVDDADLPANAEPFGLVRADGSPRPAYAALQVITQYFAGVTSAQVEQEGAVVRIVLDRDGERLTVVWNGTPRPLEAAVPARAAEAVLVHQDGEQQAIRPREGAYHLPLAPATYHTVPGRPDLYAIGGPPLILVEKADEPAGQQPIMAVASAPGCEPARSQYFDVTGHTVSGQWLAFYERAGGLDILGYPRSEVIVDPLTGQWVQYFQRAVLEWHPENPPADRILRRLLADELYPGADPPLSAAPRASRAYAFFPTSADRPTGLGHGVSDYAPDGTYLGFKSFFDAHGGVQTFGYPKEEPKLRDGRWVQRFQAAVFEYHPENQPPYRVQLELLGDKIIDQKGLAPITGVAY